MLGKERVLSRLGREPGGRKPTDSAPVGASPWSVELERTAKDRLGARRQEGVCFDAGGRREGGPRKASRKGSDSYGQVEQGGDYQGLNKGPGRGQGMSVLNSY